MKLTTILFDLDGTLLPMDQDKFTMGYFKLLTQKMQDYGYDAKELIDTVWRGTAAMVKNDGSATNEQVFWKVFTAQYGEKAIIDQEHFNRFYREEFQAAKAFCDYEPKSAKIIAKVKELGIQRVLATNPIFPKIATESRIRWAGLTSDDFVLYTTYENSCACKPSLSYYEDILRKLDVSAEECLMVGNDVSEDMVAQKLGMHVFLLTDCLINQEHKDIHDYPQGSFDQLMAYIEQLMHA